MSALLSSQEIARRLPALAGWQAKGKTIEKKFHFADFREAIGFVNRVADLAEVEDHHPDILINYKRVTLTYSTHTEGGLTEKDFAGAAAADRIA